MKRLLFVVTLACTQTVSAETAPSGLAAKVIGAEIIGGASGHFASTVTRSRSAQCVVGVLLAIVPSWGSALGSRIGASSA